MRDLWFSTFCSGMGTIEYIAMWLMLISPLVPGWPATLRMTTWSSCVGSLCQNMNAVILFNKTCECSGSCMRLNIKRNADHNFAWTILVVVTKDIKAVCRRSMLRHDCLHVFGDICESLSGNFNTAWGFHRNVYIAASSQIRKLWCYRSHAIRNQSELRIRCFYLPYECTPKSCRIRRLFRSVLSLKSLRCQRRIVVALVTVTIATDIMCWEPCCVEMFTYKLFCSGYNMLWYKSGVLLYPSGPRLGLIFCGV